MKSELRYFMRLKGNFTNLQKLEIEAPLWQWIIVAIGVIISFILLDRYWSNY